MRHFLVALLTLTQVSHLAFAGLPPTTTKGQSDASAQTTFNVQVPFNQKTSLGGVTSLLETGNGNMLTDPGFEGGGTSWTASGGTYAITTTAANTGSGARAASWDSSAAAQTLTSTTIPIPAGLYGQNAMVSCNIQGAGATHTLQAYDGTNVVASQTITSLASYVRTNLNFIAPSSGTIALRLVSVASNEPIIYVDDCYLGVESNLSEVNQATKVGAAYFANTASCSWTTTSGTIDAFGTQAACPGPTIDVNTGPGIFQTTDSDLPQWTVNNLPAGDYTAYIIAEVQSSASGTYCLAINDGTDTKGNTCFNPAASVAMPVPLMASFTYTGTANKTFKIYGSASSGTLEVANQFGTHKTQLILFRNPTAAQTAVSSNQNLFPTVQKFTSGSGTYTKPLGVSYIKVKMVGGGGGGGGGGGTGATAGGSGGSSTFGTSLLEATGGGGGTQGDNSTGGGISTAGGTASLGAGPIGTALSGGRGGTNTYGSVASGAGGSGASSPFGGEGSGGHTNGSGTSAAVNTGSGGGGGGAGSAGGYGGGGGSAGGYVEAIISAPISSYAYAVGSAGTAGGAQTGGGNNGAAGAAGGSGYIEVTEYYGAMNAPIIIGSVTSNSLGDERIERLKITNSTSSASQSGSWASVSNNGTGRASVTITAGMFSATPVCTCTTAAANNAQSMCQITGLTNTSFEARTRDSTTGGLVSEDAYVVCMGPR